MMGILYVYTYIYIQYTLFYISQIYRKTSQKKWAQRGRSYRLYRFIVVVYRKLYSRRIVVTLMFLTDLNKGGCS